MNPSPMNHKWTVTSRIFHWVGALLLFVTWLMIALHHNTDGDEFMMWHKSFGVSVLCWTIARLINRSVTHTPQSLPMPSWQKLLAHFTHFALYALLLAMPLAGIMMSQYGGRPIDIFGVFQIPVLISPDRAQARFFNNLHTDVIWPAMLLLTALHIGAALYHQFIIKDNLIGRMK